MTKLRLARLLRRAADRLDPPAPWQELGRAPVDMYMHEGRVIPLRPSPLFRETRGPKDAA